MLAAGKESQKRPACARDVLTNCSTQHWIACLECIEDRASCHFAVNLELYVSPDARKRSQVWRDYNQNHGSVWTSTESTAGRSRTIGAQVSPASADPYTCPPVVPKYTPHESSESTASASRSTFT